MSPRSIRRAAAARGAERAASRTHTEAPIAAVYTEPVAATEPVIVLENWTTCPQEISARRLLANRANARLSTGPTSQAGKRTSCLNAVRTALTGQTVLLPSDDIAAYEALLAAFGDQYKPVTLQERQLVQSLADTRWRLNRIPTLEFALFARGQQEFAERFADYEPALASAMRDAETLVVYARQLKNLHTQEGRLRRHYQQDLAALFAAQQERGEAEATAKAQTTREAGVNALGKARAHAAMPTSVEDNGFEFANCHSEPAAAPPVGINPQPSTYTRAA